MKETAKSSAQRKALWVFLGILVFGAIWGLLESTLGGALSLHAGPWLKQSIHLCPCPIIAATIGAIILASALAIYKKPTMLIGIGLVAAAFKWLTVPIHHMPASAYPVVNPAIAIFIESVAFAVIAALLMKRLEGKTTARIGAGALAGISTSIAWVYIVVYLIGAPTLTATHLSGAAAFIGTGGMVWMALCALFLPLGYLAGTKLQPRIVSLAGRRPWLYYAGSAATVACCAGGSAAALMAGL